MAGDNQDDGTDLIEQVFSPKQMVDFIEIIKKIPKYKKIFHKQLISTTRNHLQQDLKWVKTL